jgi:hypothetical protein
LAYEETVEAYFNHAVKGPQNFQEFFTTILPKCESNCNETDYAKRALRKLDENDMRLNVSTFSSGPIFQHVVSTLPIEISANTDGDDFKVKLRSDGRVFSQTFKGECNYSRKATKVKDAGFLDTLFTGADARRNFYDVYKCKTKTQDMDSMNRFLTAVGKPSEYKKFEDKGKWDYYKYTGDEKIVYERSPSTYTPAPSYESSSSSSKSSPKRSGSVTAINRNGNTTTIKCSIGKDTRVTSNGSGKCTDNYIFGSYTCSYLIEEAKKRCESR